MFLQNRERIPEVSDTQKEILFQDLGLMDYREAWDYQEERFNRLVTYKRDTSGTDRPEQYLLFCEHPHVYTLGKSGNETNLLIRQDFLKKINATYYKTNRGGDITYHGPGQIVGYPIVDLEFLGIGLKQYVALLEDAIIALLRNYRITATRMDGSTGVWLDAEHPVKARKICAIGVRSSRHITMHGFALNVNTNLDYFTYINPCGFETKGVTSMEKELGKEINMDLIKLELRKNLMQGFRSPVPPAEA
ncbi:MAG: lipoyl(octanoyl) transferase LipB [Bacteroidales bacterium]|nr:lipoyl(octanoyl) transferase LipB [Bacteroidales bacterium]